MGWRNLAETEGSPMTCAHELPKGYVDYTDNAASPITGPENRCPASRNLVQARDNPSSEERETCLT